jgi:hypothetical protein
MAGKSPRDGRAAVIHAVQTPLGFFTLTVLVVEAILGMTAGLVRGVDPTGIVWAMIALIFLLVLIVAALAYCRPEALGGKRAEQVASVLAQVKDSSPVEHIKRPSIMCISTTEFETLGAATDVAVIEEQFPKGTASHRSVTLDQFRITLTREKIDILHLLCFVDAKEGTLRFSPGEKLSAEGLERLVGICGAKLLVLATCDSVVLAAKIAHVANMIAATKSVAVQDFVAWERCFYGLLSQGHALSKSYEVARATTAAPMVLLLKRELTLSP